MVTLAPQKYPSDGTKENWNLPKKNSDTPPDRPAESSQTCRKVYRQVSQGGFGSEAPKNTPAKHLTIYRAKYSKEIDTNYIKVIFGPLVLGTSVRYWP